MVKMEANHMLDEILLLFLETKKARKVDVGEYRTRERPTLKLEINFKLEYILFMSCDSTKHVVLYVCECHVSSNFALSVFGHFHE